MKKKKKGEEKILFKIHWWIRVCYYYYRRIHFKTEPTASYLKVQNFRTFSGLLEFLERANEHLAIVSRHLNPLLANVPIFYPLKTPAGTLARNGFKCLKKTHVTLKHYIFTRHFATLLGVVHLWWEKLELLISLILLSRFQSHSGSPTNNTTLK